MEPGDPPTFAKGHIMSTVFLSYSSRDYFFAEMLGIKLSEAGFKLWRDQGSLRAGDDWRQSIEDGIAESFAVVVALSSSSADSSYVTYEWAYAIGMGKPVVPVKLSECKIHPRLEPTQYIDFSYARALPWSDLLQRLQEVDVEAETATPARKGVKSEKKAPLEPGLADEVLGYLNSHGFTMASFDRLRDRLPSKPNTSALENLLQTYPEVFRPARIKGGLLGLAKRVP